MKPASHIEHIVCVASVQSPRQSEASLIAFDDGRLLLAYGDFYAGDATDHGKARISGKWSMDEGATWGEPFVIKPNYSKGNIMEANLLLLPSGRILLAYNRVETGAGETHAPIIHLDLTHSDDRGKTWSPPRQISAHDIENCTTNDRFVRLSTGRILLPASGAASPVWISDDEGESWRQGDSTYRCHAEPAIVELADGSLKMYSRETSAGPYRHLYVADSHDGGETWTPARESPIRSAAVPCAIRRIPESEDLLLIWNNAGHRTNLTAAISRNGGATWGHFRTIEPQEQWPLTRSHAYPSVMFHNGYAHLTYWEVHKHPETGYMTHTIYRRLPIAWFYESAPLTRNGRVPLLDPSRITV
jgi:sialidase-1